MPERRTEGSNAEMAAGGQNLEASFAALDETATADMTAERDTDIAAQVKRQLERAPGGTGARYNRGEHAEP